MCRFCDCNLSKTDLSEKCAYKKNNTEINIPWSSINSYIDYLPSNCLKPSSGLPVIIHGQHIKDSSARIFHPMYWTLIPSWFKANLSKWNAVTHNARVENLLNSNNYNYSSCLNEGKRCVIPMEGFYELSKTDPLQKADVYYLSSSQENNLLKAAGLFSVSKLENGKTLHSCTILTTEAYPDVAHVHSRMPLLLKDDNAVEAWLDYKSVSSQDAVSVITKNQDHNLKYHKTVKIGFKEPLKSENSLGSKKLMANWLSSGNRKRKLNNNA